MQRARLILERLRHPWPLYRKAGTVSAVVTRADGSVEDHGVISVVYARRWSTGSNKE